MGAALLDHRYSVSSLLCADASARRFVGCHVGLAVPVRIVELRPPNQSDVGATWDAAHCAAVVARAASLRHPALPHVRDCFHARGVCYVVEDALEDERLSTRLAHRGRAVALRAALRDALQLCDAVACVARDAPELMPCLLISGSTLAYDAAGTLHLTTWDYSRWLDGRSALDPGAPDLRAPELRTAADSMPSVPSVPNERTHVYSIAALLAYQLLGNADFHPAARAGQLPLAVHAALAPALQADPRQRAPDAEVLGRALARAVRLALPALEPAPVTPTDVRATPRLTRRGRGSSHHAPSWRAQPLWCPAARAADLARHTAPRALRQAGERSRAAVLAALRHVGHPALW